MSNENISNEIVDFDLLADIRQANIRGSQFELKRNGNDKFTISNSGKLKISYDESKGVNLKAGNSIVVIAVLPKDDPRCARGLLHAHLGNSFTSNTLEAALVDNGLEADIYTFESPQEYQEATYYKIVPVVVEDETDVQEAALVEKDVQDEMKADDPEVIEAAIEPETTTVKDEGEF